MHRVFRLIKSINLSKHLDPDESVSPLRVFALNLSPGKASSPSGVSSESVVSVELGEPRRFGEAEIPPPQIPKMICFLSIAVVFNALMIYQAMNMPDTDCDLPKPLKECPDQLFDFWFSTYFAPMLSTAHNGFAVIIFKKSFDNLQNSHAAMCFFGRHYLNLCSRTV